MDNRKSSIVWSTVNKPRYLVDHQLMYAKSSLTLALSREFGSQLKSLTITVHDWEGKS